MRKFLSLLLFIPLSAMAESQMKLTIWAKDGTQVAYALDEEPKVTFTENSMVISSTKIEVNYPLQDMVRFTYGDEVTAVSHLRTDKSPFKLDGKSLLFPALRLNSVITVYSQSGTLVFQKTVRQGGEYAFPIDGLVKGVYVVKVNGVTYKFLKR